MNLIISLRSEILKTKRTASFYLAFMAGAFGPLMSMLDLIFDGVSPEDRNIIFNKMLTTKFEMASFLMLPMFIILTCTLLPQIEFKNNTWKQVLASPQPKVNAFMAKFINVQLLIVVFLITNLLLMFAGSVVLHFREPALHVLNQPIHGSEIFMVRANAYVALLAVCAMQFWLGLRFKNFIIPIAVGIALWLTGSLLVMSVKTGFAEFFPYSFHVFTSLPKARPENGTFLWLSAGYAALFLVLGYFDFKRRRMIG